MIVPLQRAVISATACTEPHFTYQSFILQVAERIVDGRKCDAWQQLSRPLKDLIRGQMIIRLANHAEDSPALFRKSQVLEIHFS